MQNYQYRDRYAENYLHLYLTPKGNGGQEEFMSEREIQELVREERRRYAREWRKKNPEKVRAANQRYWERKVKARLAAENNRQGVN